MKYADSASLIALSAAVTGACLLHINKNDNPVVPIPRKGSTSLELDTNNFDRTRGVGIKFDNNSAGKYFVLIHFIQRYAAMSKTIGKFDDSVLPPA
ncbi:MAG: hypothetical protein ABI688_09155 [Bacteroidota bacterium]